MAVRYLGQTQDYLVPPKSLSDCPMISFDSLEGITLDHVSMISKDFDECLAKLQQNAKCSDVLRLLEDEQNLAELTTFCVNDSLCKILGFTKTLQSEIDRQKVAIRHSLYSKYYSTISNIGVLREKIFEQLYDDETVMTRSSDARGSSPRDDSNMSLNVVRKVQEAIQRELSITLDSKALSGILEVNRNLSNLVLESGRIGACERSTRESIDDLMQNPQHDQRQGQMRMASIEEQEGDNQYRNNRRSVLQIESIVLNANIRHRAPNASKRGIDDRCGIQETGGQSLNNSRVSKNFASILKQSSQASESSDNTVSSSSTINSATDSSTATVSVAQTKSETNNYSRAFPKIMLDYFLHNRHAVWHKECLDLAKYDESVLNPWGVSYCEANACVYVCDRCGNRILVFDRTGHFLRTFGHSGTGRGEFNRPSSTHHDPLLDRLIVVDKDNHRIQVLDRTSEKHLFSFGEKGTKNSMFMYPWDVATDRYSNIYVSDSKNCRVQVFDSAGRYLRKITGYSTKKVNSPRGLTLIRDENILLMTDFEMHKLISIKLSYKFKHNINVESLIFHNKIQLQRPQSIDYRDGIVAIADSRCYEVKLYNLETQERVSILPSCDTEGIYPGGVCFVGLDAIFATEIEKNEVYRFVLMSPNGDKTGHNATSSGANRCVPK